MINLPQAPPPACCQPPDGPPPTLLLASDPESAGRARTYVREVLAHGEPPVAADCVDTVVLIVSELVTNAYRYGTEPGDSVLVVVSATPDCVRVEVHDPRRRRPRPREATGDSIRGRGLHIVGALAERWGVDDRPFGKKVWAEVTR
ncbi:ATP-binding protein [Streptomyces murinus]|uniref:ATP-binding protein n=1 Tax=Streptomyces murinus TaxID=33900 RepID=UPI0021151B72|nr:ATP-binding protein [Streptomyces murinus]